MKYEILVNIYEKLETTTKRLEITDIIASFIKEVDKEELSDIMLLLQGRVFPPWDSRELGIAKQLMLKAINAASGISINEIEKIWKSNGDLGLACEEAIKKKTQKTLLKAKKLEIRDVLNNIRKAASLSGKGTVLKKIGLIVELLNQATPKEAKYITKTVLSELRLGVGEGTLRDSIARAFSCDTSLIEKAFNFTSDYGEIALLAKTKGNTGLAKIKLKPGNPLKVMLYQKAAGIKEGFERVGSPSIIQYKYDGLRIQVHKDKKGKTYLFTRRLEEVTNQFPELAKGIAALKENDFIIEGEAVAYNPHTKKYWPFQELSKRIKRKYDIAELAKKIPVVLYLFDLLYYNNKNYLDKPYKERTKELKKIVAPSPFLLEFATELITSDEEEAKKFYEEALDKNQEGVMMKSLDSPYQPGLRVGFGVKIKPVMETLDLVIIGAEWGEGRRGSWLGSFTLGCINEETGELLECGKLGTGLSDELFKELTVRLKKLIISSSGRSVKVEPEIVVEVAYEEIQRSPSYSSKFALRFPRLVRVRDDKQKSDADTITRLKSLYESQGKAG